MGNCNLNCCKCIEKKETKINQISLHNQYINDIIPINTKDCLKYIIIQKDNKDSKLEEKVSFYSLDDDEKNETKRTYKYNETTQSFTNSKDVSYNFSKKNINDRYFDRDPEINLKNEEKDVNKEVTNYQIGNDINKDENEKISNINKKVNNYGYHSINMKKSNYNIYYFESKNMDNNINQGIDLNHSHIIPNKYNYQKDKYISYFTDDNL